MADRFRRTQGTTRGQRGADREGVRERPLEARAH